jgi:acyl-CoA hydrolase
MEIGVRVIREDPYTNTRTIATTAHLTFVALDDNKRPTAVPAILPETPDEKRRYQNAQIRVRNRKELLKKIKQQQ